MDFTLSSNVESDTPGTILNNLKINMNINEGIENEIFKSLREEDIISLLFLIKDIPNIDLEIQDYPDVKNKLKFALHGCAGKYTENHKYMLVELLYHIKRYDLIKHLGACRHQIKNLCANVKLMVDPYWLLLFNVCEVITEMDSVDIARSLNEHKYQEKYIESLYSKGTISKKNVKALISLLETLKEDKDVVKVLDKLHKYQDIFDFYQMDDKTNGYCLIFNMEKFSPDCPKLEHRKGSSIDVKYLRMTFEKFGFIIDVAENVSYEETDSIIKHYQNIKLKHSDYNCFILCFLSHGEQNGPHSILYTSDGKKIAMKKFFRAFNRKNCPKLAGKPKIFIIQACRGEDQLHAVHQLPDITGDIISDGRQDMEKPAYETDILECYATRQGSKSIRDTQRGSWFIQTLCRKLWLNGDKENIYTILNSVNNYIFEKAPPEYDGMQEPEFRSSLRKKLKFQIKRKTNAFQ